MRQTGMKVWRLTSTAAAPVADSDRIDLDNFAIALFQVPDYA